MGGSRRLAPHLIFYLMHALDVYLWLGLADKDHGVGGVSRIALHQMLILARDIGMDKKYFHKTSSLTLSFASNPCPPQLQRRLDACCKCMEANWHDQAIFFFTSVFVKYA
jgi:hypothetical protein